MELYFAAGSSDQRCFLLQLAHVAYPVTCLTSQRKLAGLGKKNRQAQLAVLDGVFSADAEKSLFWTVNFAKHFP